MDTSLIGSVVDGLTFLAAVCGFIASWHWYLSSTVRFPVMQSTPLAEYQKKLDESLLEAGRRNKLGAIWTALAAGVGAIAALFSLAT